MHTIVFIFVSLLPATAAFLTAPHSNAAAVNSKVLAAPKPDMSDTIDIEHAKYCSDHFGECSLEDMERIRNALHQERVTHTFTNTDGLQNPHGLEEDIEHKLLESDLTLQMGLLQDKIATQHMRTDSMAAYGMNPYSFTMNTPVLDGGLDEESSEALMICLTIAGLALLPQFL
mmetsp:Transcript_37378/g.67214  ORF Transcript_37378/g.67214 Transcript_37378/m.67214 type:complete len:173 (+) Transcript_37378:70-588(+)|eukprot:CAMPEP_0201882778 /NCGR_PEP_ID=MMETSP0902-20130614/14500_1 /ASSEMBLY_ACC=CAM_ASM_000551 /TAXON_ID=420261 /ORGANISM="Thalassiosira antarctica, Strain CCMP982" /LENGTH=172 /DNA_ID=CAMNT_0048411387 /DNA_START=64 /DNA_END=582 /DNA_ORIENTATION=+